MGGRQRRQATAAWWESEGVSFGKSQHTQPKISSKKHASRMRAASSKRWLMSKPDYSGNAN
jgi:hypothetical protein